jgi:hypothetical protein
MPESWLSGLGFHLAASYSAVLNTSMKFFAAMKIASLPIFQYSASLLLSAALLKSLLLRLPL